MRKNRVMVTELPALECDIVHRLLGGADDVEIVDEIGSADVVVARLDSDRFADEWRATLEARPRMTLVGLSFGYPGGCVVRLEPRTEILGDVSGDQLLGIVRAAASRMAGI